MYLLRTHGGPSVTGRSGLVLLPSTQKDSCGRKHAAENLLGFSHTNCKANWCHTRGSWAFANLHHSHTLAHLAWLTSLLINARLEQTRKLLNWAYTLQVSNPAPIKTRELSLLSSHSLTHSVIHSSLIPQNNKNDHRHSTIAHPYQSWSLWPQA